MSNKTKVMYFKDVEDLQVIATSKHENIFPISTAELSDDITYDGIVNYFTALDNYDDSIAFWNYERDNTFAYALLRAKVAK